MAPKPAVTALRAWAQPKEATPENGEESGFLVAGPSRK